VVDLDGDDLGATTGVMPRFLALVHARLRAELSRSNPLPAFESKWLLDHLKENEWWLKAGKARWVLKQLGKCVHVHLCRIYLNPPLGVEVSQM
jgi:hypothetical protein